MRVALTMIEGEPRDARWVLGPGEYLFGRSHECHIRIGISNTFRVSRRHCLLTVTEQGAFVRDLFSRNGTVVNSERITGDRTLRDGDRLKLGSLVLLVGIKGSEPCNTGCVVRYVFDLLPMRRSTYPLIGHRVRVPSAHLFNSVNQKMCKAFPTQAADAGGFARSETTSGHSNFSKNGQIGLGKTCPVMAYWGNHVLFSFLLRYAQERSTSRTSSVPTPHITSIPYSPRPRPIPWIARRAATPKADSPRAIRGSGKPLRPPRRPAAPSAA
jgi:pSer/pThr/pTyr-binding forkhead associated (FHA) protein